MWLWIIGLAIIVALWYALTRTDARDALRKSSAAKAAAGKNFLPPIPHGFQIFSHRLSVAGVQHRREDALAFADSTNQVLTLEREDGNAHDANAIKVIGVGGGSRRWIGYVPKEIAEQIVGSGLFDNIQARLERIWRNDGGFVDITFQIVGPKKRKKEYDGFPTGKPADASQKESLKHFGLPVAKGLTIGQAETAIEQHRKT